MSKAQRTGPDGTPALLAEFTVAEHGVSLTAEISEVVSWDMEGTPREAEVLLQGYLKWDGCADFDLGEIGVEAYRLHTCGRRGAKIVGQAVEFFYDLGLEHLKGWQGE